MDRGDRRRPRSAGALGVAQPVQLFTVRVCLADDEPSKSVLPR